MNLPYCNVRSFQIPAPSDGFCKIREENNIRLIFKYLGKFNFVKLMDIATLQCLPTVPTFVLLPLHMISQPILAQELFAAQLAHLHRPLHVNHLSMGPPVGQTWETFATILAHMLEILLVDNADVRA